MDTGKFGLARISLASPEQILQWSKGEVLKPETINYRTLKPERDGLFSERIFGPEKDWECSCGKYKRERYKGIICDKCGVEVLPNRVRRERMGHISLASPVSHIWYAKGMPCRLGLLLDISPRELEKVLYYAQYITIRVNEDARKRLIVRREKELALKLTKIQASTQNDRNKAEAAFEEARDRVLVERDSQIEDVDEDISTRSSAAIAEVQALILWANGHVGELAPEAQRLSWVEQDVVAKGSQVPADLESVINSHYEDLSDQLSRELGEKKAEIVQEAAVEVDTLREDLEAAFEEKHNQVLVERDRQIEDVDNDISTRLSTANAEIQALILWVNKHVGKLAPETQQLSWVEQVIVAKGSQVPANLEVAINGHFEDLSDQLSRELEEKKAEIVQEVAAEADSLREDLEKVFEKKRDQVLVERDQQIKDIEEDISTRLSSADAEVQTLIRWVYGYVGKSAPESQRLSWVKRVVVAKGRRVPADLESVVNGYFDEFADQLAQESEEKKAETVQDAAAQVDDLREQAERELAELDATEEQSREKLIETMEESLKGLKEIHTGMLISDHEYRNMVKQYGNTFEARMGAEGILELLRKIDLDDLIDEMREIIRTSRSEQKRTKAAKRLRVFVDLKKSGNRPEWMILTELPVIPPELRPMVQLDGGRFATSDLNDLYRRVINRNNRLKRLLELNAPDVIVRNEKRMLQEAVDSLIDNRKRNRNTANRNQRHPLKSLTDMLKGKQGRFRRNLLGKRVDYSGRSVIVVGPDLKLQQAGIPKSMALELFKPFVIENLVRNGTATNVRHAKRMVDTAEEEVWDVLETITRERPVLLNRAPTLHRLGIQAFEVKLIEGSAIQLHPLVCTAFNADFDGDQMAVHVPLSNQAVREARDLMLASRNLLKPSSGEPIISPTKDMVMGVFYLTLMEERDPPVPDADLRHYPNPDQAVYAHEQGKVGLREPVMVRLRPYVEQQTVADLDLNPRWVKALDVGGLETVAQLRSAIADAGSHEEFQDRVHDFGEAAMAETLEALAAVAEEEKPVEPPMFKRTTVGRIIFNRVLPPQMPFVNERLDKAGVSEVVHYAYQFLGMEETAEVADRIKALGFRYATLSGITMAVSDLEVPADKGDIIEEARQQELQLEAQYNRGLMTTSEMERGRIEAWNGATNQVSTRIREMLNPTNSVGAMSISGAAKGGHTTINQLAGMRGLMYDPNGRIIPMPIRSNFRDGLTTMEYFISTHGSRKGLADTALRTADAGYLTRRLVDVAQDVIISHEDCGTPNGIVLDVHADKAHRTLSDLEGPREIWLGPQVEKILARCLAQNVVDPTTGEVLFLRNHLITDVEVSTLVERGIEQIEVRTPLTCDSRFGLCRYCYGSNLASREMVELGDAVGIIAAQSIGEPGTQLTLRTFHSGGVASSQDITRGLPRVEELFEARIPKGEAVISELDGTVSTYFDGDVRMVQVSREDELHRPVPVPMEGWDILIAIGDSVQADMPVAMAKEAAELPQPPDSHMIRAGMEGVVDQVKAVGDGGTIHVRRTVPHTWEAEIPAYTEPLVKDADHVTAGTQLTPGALDPKRILEISGREACQLYIRDEVQKVYVEQGVAIHDKHIEVILRQLLRRVQVQATGDTEFLLGEYVDRYRFEDVNDRMVDEGLKPAQGALKLLGMTRAALMTDSFLAAASFQETTRVLTDAAIKGQVDRLRGLKENVILGNLIPVGTGFHQRLTEEARIGAGSRDTEVGKGLGDMASDLEFLQELADSDDILGAALAVGELDSLQNVGLGDDADDLEEEEEAVEPE